MTQEEKQLLIKDLCARLPYGVKVLLHGSFTDSLCKTLAPNHIFGLQKEVLDVKPCLRPMSSMTDEEINEFILMSDTVLWLGDKKSTSILSFEQIDWLNAHHFDYRGLIEKGLAIAIIEENNPY